jgi:hypothetical protein
MRYTALRNRLRLLAQRLPGPGARVVITGGLPPERPAENESSPAATDPPPVRQRAVGAQKACDTSQG